MLKSDFLTAMTAATLVGVVKALSAANTTTDAMTATAHGKATGFGPVRLANAGGALPAGLATNTDYFLIVVDANTVKFATSAVLAAAGTAVDITGTGTGTHSMSCTMQTLANQMETAVASHLTFPGNKDQTAAVNTSVFWTFATSASF